jgi:hypothetical protein
MSTRGFDAVEAVLVKIDTLAERGSKVMRAAAGLAWLGAVAATVAVFSLIGAIGWLIGIGCLIPGWILWRYGAKLAGVLDVARIRGQLDDAADLAKSRIGEVVGGIKDTRTQPIRGGLSVLKAVRTVRADLVGFGIDVSGIAEIANVASLSAAAGSLFAGLGLWAVAAVGTLLRIVL